MFGHNSIADIVHGSLLWNQTGCQLETNYRELSRIRSRMDIKIDWLVAWQDLNNKNKIFYQNITDFFFTNFTGTSLQIWTERLACKCSTQCCLSLSSLWGALRLRAAKDAEVRAGWEVPWLVLPSLPVACLMFTLNLLISLLAVVRSLWSCSSRSRSLQN